MCCAGRGDEERQPLDGILVLCPNAALCQQVHTFLVSCFSFPSHHCVASSSRSWLWWPSACRQLLQWQSCKALLSQLPCTQVVAFANALRGPDGTPLVRAAHVATNSPPPRDVPDLVTATPAGLITATQNYGPFFGWEWTRAGIMARCGATRLADNSLRGAVPCLPAWR